MEKVLFDSHPFLSYFLKTEKEKVAKEAISGLVHGKKDGVISTIALVEIKYRIMKKLGHELAEQALFLIKNSPNLQIADVSQNISELAAEIRFKYYKKNSREMSYADAIHIATAILNRCDYILTGDPDFKNLEEIKAEVY